MSRKIANESCHTYLDINICNNNIDNDNSNPVPIVFQSKRDADYLSNPQDYFLSVIRWSLDCRLPIIIPQIDLSYNNGLYDPSIGGYKTIYSVTLQIKRTGYATQEVQKYIIFIPQRKLRPPTQALTSMSEVYDISYFYIDSVQYFMDLVNVAMKEAFNDVVALWQTNIGTLPILNQYPFLLYNYDGNFTLNTSIDFLDTKDVTAGKGVLYMNSSLYTLFNGFSSLLQGYDSTSPQDITNGKNNLIQFISQYQTTTFNTVDYIYMLSEYPCVQFWSPISSIVFSSNGIPVEPTNTTPTNVIGNVSALASSNNNLNLAPIITDFDINLVTGVESRQITYYSASVYRLFDLNSNRPLGVINIIVGWKDKLTGSVHQMYLYSGGAGTMKIMFRKKTFYQGGD